MVGRGIEFSPETPRKLPNAEVHQRGNLFYPDPTFDVLSDVVINDLREQAAAVREKFAAYQHTSNLEQTLFFLEEGQCATYAFVRREMFGVD